MEIPPGRQNAERLSCIQIFQQKGREGLTRVERVLWSVAGFCAAAVCLLIWTPRRKPIEELAHNLELAWADHHTVV